MIIVDNFIPPSYQERYKNILLNSNFPWFYTSDVTYENPIHQHRPCVTHQIYNQGNHVSALSVESMGHFAAEKAGFNLTAITQGKAILQFPLNQNLIVGVDNLHVDVDPFYPHTVLLYYVVDSDGDTLIYNKTAQLDEKASTQNLNPDNYQLINRITPKQGRAVIFNGAQYHTAEQPTKGIRCIVNLNLI